MNTDTIVAQCTPSGNGALALIRISGPDALSIADKCARLGSEKRLLSTPSHTIHYGWVINQKRETIDQVMFLVMHAPRTFTGHPTVEITSHNNPFIIEGIIEEFIKAGARKALNGEFSRQAVENGKIDLVQAEAINDLIHANSQQLLKQSLSQLKGSFSSWIATLEEKLLKMGAFCQASFEFLEEEIDFSPQLNEILNNLFTDIKKIKQSFNTQQQLREGVRIALVGSVNAGKSSLFNALIGRERAIVTNIAGTTRDVIEAGLYKNGTYLTLVDTAGLRQTDDVIEQEGIKRSYQEAESADIILLVIDGSRPHTPQEEEIYSTLKKNHNRKLFTIVTKNDLASECSVKTYDCSVSNQTGSNIEKVEELIEERIKKLFHENNSPFLLNQRHVHILTALEAELEKIKELMQVSIEYEILDYHINQALSTASELTGKSVNEKVMDTVFHSFCVGK